MTNAPKKTRTDLPAKGYAAPLEGFENSTEALMMMRNAYMTLTPALLQKLRMNPEIGTLHEVMTTMRKSAPGTYNIPGDGLEDIEGATPMIKSIKLDLFGLSAPKPKGLFG